MCLPLFYTQSYLSFFVSLSFVSVYIIFYLYFSYYLKGACVCVRVPREKVWQEMCPRDKPTHGGFKMAVISCTPRLYRLHGEGSSSLFRRPVIRFHTRIPRVAVTLDYILYISLFFS